MNDSALKRVVVAGGTGLVGRALVRSLTSQGVQVIVLTRKHLTLQLPTGAAAHGWDHLPPVLDGADAVINLAGEGIADHRWSDLRKTAILDSRILATRQLVDAMKACTKPPSALVNASAIGFYDATEASPLDERSTSGLGFLPEVWNPRGPDPHRRGVGSGRWRATEDGPARALVPGLQAGHGQPRP
jgi:hypothetical protein